MLSTILLLPHPLGPMIPVTPSSKLTTVLSAKLLNPLISKLLSLTSAHLGMKNNRPERPALPTHGKRSKVSEAALKNV
jgi:hypothetical protein